MAHPIKHFLTITKHRHLVIRLCRRAGILIQGLRHDLSKYHPTEFLTGARYFTGHHSPNEEERREYGYSAAWLRHKGRNRHHLEYWTDYNRLERRTAGVKMPTRFFVEMICDRIAACKIYQGAEYVDRAPYEYYLHSRHAGLVHPETDRILNETLLYLAENGEERLFAQLREMVRADREAEKQRGRDRRAAKRAGGLAAKRRRKVMSLAQKEGERELRRSTDD
ncbi:MAG: DUF5662 family protein [Fastidiosipilaceae bacterium]